MAADGRHDVGPYDISRDYDGIHRGDRYEMTPKEFGAVYGYQ